MRDGVGMFSVCGESSKHYQGTGRVPVPQPNTRDLRRIINMVRKRVLIIDDEDGIREVARISLELIGGWEVITYSSGSEGLTIAMGRQPDAILLYVMMPDMDGPATFERLKSEEITRSIPVILLTGKEGSSDHDEFEALGVQGVITKPFDPLTFPSDVSNVLGWPPLVCRCPIHRERIPDPKTRFWPWSPRSGSGAKIRSWPA